MTNIKHNSTIYLLIGALAVCICLADVQAGIMLDLTTAGASGTINDALFVQIDPQSTGTGVIDPFVRIQRNGTEQGYNTDYRADKHPFVQFDEDTNAQWNHALALNSIPKVTIGTEVYRQFLLDLNEDSGSIHEYISLYELEIYVHNDPLLHNYSSGWGTPIYDLDGDGSEAQDAYIELDYSLNDGSGSGDMFAYIPDSLFVGGSYVTLYSAFGVPSGTSDGFEEWAVLVPVPASVIIGMLGIGVAGIKLRKFA